MKRYLLKIFVIVFTFVTVQTAYGQISSWTLTTNGAPSGVNSNITADNFTSAGVGTLTFGASGAYANGWPTGLISTSSYFEISISPKEGYTINLTALNFGERRSSTGIREYQVRWSIDNFSTFTTIATVPVPDNDSERSGNISGLDIDVEYGQTLKIRWYGYSAEATTGTWRINDGTLNVVGTVTSTGSPKPEPSNHITDLDYQLTDNWIKLIWTGSTGDDIPDGYLILGKKGAGSFASVTDATAVPDDNNWADNNYAKNVAHSTGTNNFTVTGLDPNTAYDFVIYPFTNSGTNINYKTNGVVPSISKTTASSIAGNNFESGLGWTAFQVPGSFGLLNWATSTTGGGANSTATYATMNGFSVSSQITNTWLISPAIDFSTYLYEGIEFYTSWQYGSVDENDFLKCKYSTDYSGDPTSATWTELSFSYSLSANTWLSSGLITFPSISSSSFYVAFEYSSNEGARAWRVDEIRIFGSSDSPLPVELTSFTAKVIGGKVNLNWATATEVNNFGFEVERSLRTEVGSQNPEWKTIGFVPGHGNSNSVKEYLFSDIPNHSSIQPYNHSFRYRLKQIDNDGSFAYSKEVEVENLRPSTFDLRQNFPNPFNPSTVISYQLPVSAQVSLKVYDILGNEVASLVDLQQEAGSYNVTLDASTLASGTYIYRLIAGDYVAVKKMAVLK